MIPVTLDRVHDGCGHAGLLEDRFPILWMPRGVALVVEVVEQPRDRPGLLVLTELHRERAHDRLHGEPVLAQAVRLGVLAEEIPSLVAIHRCLLMASGVTGMLGSMT